MRAELWGYLLSVFSFDLWRLGPFLLSMHTYNFFCTQHVFNKNGMKAEQPRYSSSYLEWRLDFTKKGKKSNNTKSKRLISGEMHHPMRSYSVCLVCYFLTYECKVLWSARQSIYLFDCWIAFAAREVWWMSWFALMPAKRCSLDPCITVDER